MIVDSKGDCMFQVKKYTNEMKSKWDDFVMNHSVNGTFLQTKNFLDYHPVEKFEDASLIVEDNDNNIYCVIPACTLYENGKKVFFSHKGSTYGGLVVNKRYYQVEYVQEMLDLLEQYLASQQYEKIVLKITPDILSTNSPALLEYMLGYNGYCSYQELSTYVDLNNLSENILDSFNANKRKLVRRMLESNYEFKELTQDKEVEVFHQLLTINLSKYNCKPIHTIEDLLDFKNQRLEDDVRFFGIFEEEKIIAAGMMFEFPQLKVSHAQNLSCNPFEKHGKLDPITFLYYHVIRYYREHGYAKLSWGISTEDQGKVLNTGLIKNKESYGSTYSINRTFYKELG